MRKLVFTALVSAALLAIAPAAALARDHHRGRSHHHRSHHVRTHFRRFGTRDVTTPGSPSPTPSGDSAGTVTRFANGVLTITLNNGDRVSGQVSDATELECTAGMSAMSRGDGGGSDDQGGDQGDHHSGDNGDDNGGGDDPGDDNGEDNGGVQTCSTSALTPGTVVQEAELKISSAGPAWDKLELVTQ